MSYNQHVVPLYDASGNLYAVMLSAELWQRGQKRIEPALHKVLDAMNQPEIPEPIEEWETFAQYWDFKYPLTHDVTCGGCQATTADWVTDPAKPFTLKSAQLGGLVVFKCNGCGATVRKKHFKDHYCFEFTSVSA